LESAPVFAGCPLVIDNPEKTQQLLAVLEAALPFEADLTSDLLAKLTEEQFSAGPQRRQTVSKVSYAGDMGGILCHMQPENEEGAIVASITHVRVPARLPFAAAVVDYQKHRVKKLRKSGER
jgi:hypothetical protein